MKKLNLDETWRLCLKMWRWIAKEKKLHPRIRVATLKHRWAVKNGFDVEHDCFFCQYDTEHRMCCLSCPAVKIDGDFSCHRPQHDHRKKPAAFLKEITRLNKIRLKRKAK